ncbi:MAG: DegT/DnrJ/EryC1/StrS aminotransferase [Arcobacter sp.]|nr:MAG: DegT/DnrJ/EryC1/StrS aminotransferase [Arcobacter sp.]
MNKLAINGGKKVRKEKFPRYNKISKEEIKAVTKVMEDGVLSKFIGAWCDDFYGGEKVQEFEKKWSEKFDAKYSISVNSNSSGIVAALGACGIGLDDEVIVSPYSMSISATAPLVYNATPVFCDLNMDNYGFDLKHLKSLINKNTKVLIVVHIFGIPSDMDEILKIAQEHNLYVIEDCAQAPLATYKGKKVGTLGDIGIFSLNYHKHIHTGEGGICTTNDKELANKMQLIRNHAESVIEDKGDTNLINMLGFNFRLTELQAAIGLEQLKKLDDEVKLRQKYAKMYDEALDKYPFIKVNNLQNRQSAYYIQVFEFDEEIAGISRDIFIEAVKAELEPVKNRENEGVPIYQGYVKPLYFLPIFQRRQVYNKKSFCFKNTISYEEGICPNVEKLYNHTLWEHDLTRGPLNKNDIQDVILAYTKVCDNIDELKK